jgi:simple sugar transport system ATP-binding protein
MSARRRLLRSRRARQGFEFVGGQSAQKLVVARALEWSGGVVVAADPTRGLDVGAARFVRERLAQAADAGKAVLLISTDLDEIFELSDRIGVLYEGRYCPTKTGCPAMSNVKSWAL